jgi:2-phosphosulfolactate phosphatase
MRYIETCLSPDLVHLHTLEDKTVIVIDILRATSCFVAGIASGVELIVPKSSPEECMAMRNEGYLIAGERNGLKISDFDLGNSPLEYMKCAGKKIAATTTNGTKAILLSQQSQNTIIGSFLNFDAVVEFVKNQSGDLLLMCSGWKGRFSMEDSLFAGALVNAVYEDFMLVDDASIACQSLYLSAKNDMFIFLKNCSHFSRLKDYGLEDDLRFCLKMNQFDVLATVKNSVIVKA